MAALRNLTEDEEWAATAWAAKQPRGDSLWDQLMSKLMGEVSSYCEFYTIAGLPMSTKLDPWAKLTEWLESYDGEWFVEAALNGSLPVYAAEEMLTDFNIEPTKANMKQLAEVLTSLI